MCEETSQARIIVEISAILPMFSAFFAIFRIYLGMYTVYIEILSQTMPLTITKRRAHFSYIEILDGMP